MAGWTLAAIDLFRLPNVAAQTLKISPAAQLMYKKIAQSIINFEKTLDPDKEIGAQLVSFNSNETISIENLGYWGDDLIIFYGKNSLGNSVELLQHISQVNVLVNVLLVAVPVEGEARRIEFILEKQLAQSGNEVGS